MLISALSLLEGWPLLRHSLGFTEGNPADCPSRAVRGASRVGDNPPMPRYDFMHWSQRARERHMPAPTVPSASPQPAAPPRQARPARPKPPRDEAAEHLLRLCREGRLFELQAWVADGKPLTVPTCYRQTPLRVALETGFHSLIAFLLQHETSQPAKDAALREAVWSNRPGLIALALEHGASVHAVPFQEVIETWDRPVAALFLSHGADPVTNGPFARAFKQRVKAGLGIYLDCLRARPDLADALQAQSDMALRQACQDEDVKWVSLLRWLGASPRSKGLSTDDLDHDVAEDPDYQQSALQIACSSRRPEILRQLKPDPAHDDLRELMAAAGGWTTTPETVAYLVSLGADVNDRADGSSTVLDAALRHFGWKEAVWEGPYGAYRRAAVPLAKLQLSLDALRTLISRGARWVPEARAITEVRRALYRTEAAAVMAVVDLLRAKQACSAEALAALTAAPKMRALLALARKTEAVLLPAATSRAGTSPTAAAAPPRPVRHSHRYDRQRLYDEVWKEPSEAVAKHYGVTGVALAKACRLMDVPKPPRGYWAKVAAGRKLPKRPPLPK